MQLDINFKKICAVPPELINEAAELCGQIDWASDKYNRINDNALAPYSKILYYPTPLTPKPFYDKEFTIADKRLTEVCSLLRDCLPEQYKHMRVVNGEIATLIPKSVVKLHYDDSWYHKVSHRIHIPLKSNDKSMSMWYNFNTRLSENYAYEINNRVQHGAMNMSNEYRTHFIFDLCDPNIWDENKKANNPPHRFDYDGLRRSI
jgi:hypothetical protein